MDKFKFYYAKKRFRAFFVVLFLFLTPSTFAFMGNAKLPINPIIALVNDVGSRDSTVISIKAALPVLEAVDDFPDPINMYTGGYVTSILKNDRLDGRPIKDFEVSISHQGFTPSLNYNMDNLGNIEVFTQAQAGTYTMEYTIFLNGNNNVFSTATIKIEIYARKIEAFPDSYAGIIGHSGGNTHSVIENDLLDNQPATLDKVTVKPIRASSDSLQMKPDGTVWVKPYTPAGTYTIEYFIEENENRLNYAKSKMTIEVVEADLQALDDVATGINGKEGGITQSVFENDLIEGKKLLPKDVKLNAGASPVSGMLMNVDGTVRISPGTPSNTYNYPYEICELINPANCSSAVMRITVSAAKVLAVDDISIGIHALTGGITQSVLANDQLNAVTVIPAEIVLTPDASPLQGMNMNIDGSVTVLAGTPAGTYNFGYKICELINPTNCSRANMLITVFANMIDAQDDVALGMNGYAGATTVSVLNNDRLNSIPITVADVILKPGTAPLATMSMLADGTVSIAAGTPAAVYRFHYTICERANPRNCSAAVIVITVVPALIQAVDDAWLGVNGANGAVSESVMNNDLLNGLPVKAQDVLLKPGASPAAGISMALDGKVTVAPGTVPGNYSYPYMLCSVLNPSNCSPAVLFINVVRAGLSISKTADKSSVERVGEQIRYSILVKNTGGVDLYDVLVSDMLFTNWREEIGLLAAGKEHRIVLDYTVTQADMESDRITNIARVDGKDADAVAYQEEAKLDILIKDNPRIFIQKTADRNEVSEVGELIEYLITIENTGNKALYEIEVRDPLTKLFETIKQLNPGEKHELKTQYRMIREDFAAGALLNEVVVSARDANERLVSSKATYRVLIVTLPLMIPNVFTPNGDGLNDVFFVKGLEAFDQVSLKVFNVWGNEVYVNDKYDNKWNGHGLQDGTYYYSIEMRKGDKLEKYKAWVLIKRN